MIVIPFSEFSMNFFFFSAGVKYSWSYMYDSQLLDLSPVVVSMIHIGSVMREDEMEMIDDNSYIKKTKETNKPRGEPHSEINYSHAPHLEIIQVKVISIIVETVVRAVTVTVANDDEEVVVIITNYSN